MLGRLAAEQMEEIGRLNERIADLAARLDQAQAMILEREAIITEQAQRLNERDAKLPGHYSLIALCEAADNACLDAFTGCPDCRTQAINWGDLQCVRAERYTTEDGTVGHRVWIEEADPSAYHLRDYVRGHLERAGFAGVDVMLEW